VRHLGVTTVEIATLEKARAFTGTSAAELREACDWLVDQGHATWLADRDDAIQLTAIGNRPAGDRRSSRQKARTAVGATTEVHT
jgi:hypothetical protein